MEPEEVVRLWNTTCVPPFKPVKILNATRAQQIRYASKEILDWPEFFRIIAVKEGNWLMGKAWMCFNWAIDPENRVKIYEEDYLTPPDADNEGEICVPRS